MSRIVGATFSEKRGGMVGGRWVPDGEPRKHAHSWVTAAGTSLEACETCPATCRRDEDGAIVEFTADKHEDARAQERRASSKEAK